MLELYITDVLVAVDVLELYITNVLVAVEHAGAAGGDAQWSASGEGPELRLPAVQGHPLVSLQRHHPQR